MKRVTLEDALAYTSLSDISAAQDGSRVLYRTHRPRPATNDYEHKVILRERDQETAFSDIIGRPAWRETTAYYVVADGRYAANIFSYDDKENLIGHIPFHASVQAVAEDGTLILQARIDLSVQRAIEAGVAPEKAIKDREEQEKDAFVIDEFPYWVDGEGVTNKLRTQLFLFKDGELARITEETLDVKRVAYDEASKTVFYTGAAFTVQPPLGAGLYAYDLHTGKNREVFPVGAYSLLDIGTLNGRLYFAGAARGKGEKQSRGRRVGFYILQPEEEVPKRLAETEISYGGSVFSDVVYGSGQNFQVTEEGILFLGTWHEKVAVFLATTEGVKPYVQVDGVIHGFYQTTEGLYFQALVGPKHQELYLQKDGIITQLTSYNTDFDTSHDLSTPESLSFVDKYGETIIGWVLRPMGEKEEQTFPAILDIHGGPAGAYGSVYYHEMQYWAAHGYYVLFANPTGGTGRGSSFSQIRGGTGGSDFEDLMAFVDLALETYPKIDPNRLGITGGSYGGFMTNWAIGHTDRFKAAASQRSTANNITEAANKDIAPGFIRSMTEPTAPDAVDKLWALSPLAYIGPHTVTPTLFLHSLEDYRCYHVESLQMYAALQYLQVPTRMVLFKKEHHGLSRDGHPRNRLRRLREITDWMDKYLREENV